MKKQSSASSHELTFSERVVRAARSVPKGKVTTYGRIARAAGGSPRTAQSITSILSQAAGKGTDPIPFHRIVYADGRIWVDDVHRAKRMKLYAAEGIKVDKDDRIVDFHKALFEFK